MSARYVLDITPHDFGDHFGIRVTDNFPPRYNIAPSQPVPVIRADRKGGREYALVRWGFVPGWDTKGTFFRKSIAVIRSETAHEKPSFRNAWKRRRCLFPVNGFYEWLDTPDGKQPYFITLGEDRPLFSLAGLWEHWSGEDGGEMETAAFLTRDADDQMRDIHDRVPVIVPQDRYDDWLHRDETDLGAVQEILRLDQPDFTFWPVSRRVNSWKPDDAALIERVEPVTQGELL